MTKNILVPLDISSEEAAEAAVVAAKKLARLDDGKLTLLNVVEQFTGYTSAYLPEDFYEKAVAEAKTTLQAIAARHGLSDTANIVVREGTPATEVLNHAQETKADLIVIASHDPGVADYFLGSVAARVVRHAHCSVHVVRKTK